MNEQFSIGDRVINRNDLSIQWLREKKLVLSQDIYVITSSEEDNGYIETKNINTGRVVQIRKDCLIKVF